ncbi:MAG: hypothetical protein AAF797_07040 [Planctomycetota bacterium]
MIKTTTHREVLQSVRDVMIAAAGKSVADSELGYASIDDLKADWRLLVYFDVDEDQPHEDRRRHSLRLITTLIRRDDPSQRNPSDHDDNAFMRAFEAFRVMHDGLLATADDPDGTPLEGLPFEPHRDSDPGVVVTGVEDRDRACRIGSRWDVMFDTLPGSRPDFS